MPVDFIVNVTVNLSGNPQANSRVILRNERTNKSLSANTNASGKAVFSCNNLEDGWTTGDILTSSVIYSSYEASESHTILTTEGGWTVTLALTTVAVSDLNYCTIQDVYDDLSFKASSTNITAEQIRKIGLRVEDQIERRCNTIFHDNGGSYTTVTQEYHDVRNGAQRYFFLTKRPIVTFTLIELNTADDSNATGTWTDVTSNCKTDTETGRVDIIATLINPIQGTKMFRATYTYGFAITPEDIQELTILMIKRKLMSNTTTRALISGRDEFSDADITGLNKEIDEIFSRWTYTADTNI